MNSPARWHCLVMLLVHLDVWVVAPKFIGIHENGLVADVLRTLYECFRVLILDVVFKLLVVFGSDAVPKLWCSVVIVVDTGEIQILRVPAEHRPESADVEVRASDSRQVNFSESISNQPTLTRCPVS